MRDVCFYEHYGILMINVYGLPTNYTYRNDSENTIELGRMTVHGYFIYLKNRQFRLLYHKNELSITTRTFNGIHINIQIIDGKIMSIFYPNDRLHYHGGIRSYLSSDRKRLLILKGGIYSIINGAFVGGLEILDQSRWKKLYRDLSRENVGYM